ncbi:hypothetical protein [Rhodococcus triatomae]|nr:hypothetical protein G419_13751 [Rhodococcus triatomae BKS 15-14]
MTAAHGRMAVPHGRHRLPESAETLRLRSARVIASTSAVAAAVPTAAVSGSIPLALLVGLGTVLGVGAAGIMI